MIRLAVVDDHPLVRQGLRSALATVDDVAVVAEVSTCDGARELLGRPDLDVVLLDIRLEDGNGLSVLAEHDAERPRVLIISSFSASQYVAAAVRFGAAGFLLKTAPTEELVAAIRVVAAGGSTFSREQRAQPFVTLQPREREVLGLALEGGSNHEIAAALGVTVKAVEEHLTDLYRRYGISGGRVELLLRAERQGWLDAPSAQPVRRARVPMSRGRAYRHRN
jgi:DNA-binding NarL/FixJ family response regulator